MFDSQYYLMGLEIMFDEFKESYNKSLEIVGDMNRKRMLMLRTTNFIHWLLDVYEKKNIRAIASTNENDLFTGLRHANNKLKHDEFIFDVSILEGGFECNELAFPLSCEEFSYKFIYLPYESNYHNNSIAYANHLYGEDVEDTLLKIKNILKSYLI